MLIQPQPPLASPSRPVEALTPAVPLAGPDLTALPRAHVAGGLAPGIDPDWARKLLEENARLRRLVDDLRPYKDLAYRDALTGLWNRRYAEERLRDETSRVQRRVSAALSIILLDIDCLKGINERFGRAVGDRMLAAVSGCLGTSVRSYDACCRVDGDGFLLILPDADDEMCAAVLARVREGLAALHAGVGLTLQVSVGCASAPDDALFAEELLDKAAAALAAEQTRAQPCNGSGE